MSFLSYCGSCCLVISTWGVIQLALMGFFFKVEAVLLIEEVVPMEYTDYEDFIKKTKDNYATVAFNCWIAAALYLLMIGISYMCLKKARSTAAREIEILEDDELSCKPRINL